MDHVEATEGTSDHFRNEKEEFLFRTFGFGHLHVHQPEEVEFISPDQLLRMLGNQRAERWLSELLQSTSDEEFHIARLPADETNLLYQQLFFSEMYVFQQYIETQRLPILNLADQSRIILITNLPNDRDLLKLEPTPSKFWEELV